MNKRPASNTIECGSIGETLAQEFLIGQGLQLYEANYYCRYGEIDLIMLDPVINLIVFVEVRYRQHIEFGGALESIDHRKRQKLIRSANHYLQQMQLLDMPARFDVVGFTSLDRSGLTWIQDAFDG